MLENAQALFYIYSFVSGENYFPYIPENTKGKTTFFLTS
jgi:hypothetical protein